MVQNPQAAFEILQSSFCKVEFLLWSCSGSVQFPSRYPRSHRKSVRCCIRHQSLCFQWIFGKLFFRIGRRLRVCLLSTSSDYCPPHCIHFVAPCFGKSHFEHPPQRFVFCSDVSYFWQSENTSAHTHGQVRTSQFHPRSSRVLRKRSINPPDLLSIFPLSLLDHRFKVNLDFIQVCLMRSFFACVCNPVRLIVCVKYHRTSRFREEKHFIVLAHSVFTLPIASTL